MSRLLLCTDLDRTLIPNGTADESASARSRFAAFTAREELQLAYVSGRDQALIMQAIEEYNLPQPDFAIADVGASIYRAGHDDCQRLAAWDAAIGEDWSGCHGNDLHALIRDIPLLRLQEQEKQGRFKLSYYLPIGENEKAVIATIRNRFEREGIRANLIWSVDDIEGVGLLDILPVSANKLHAIRFLMQMLDYSESDTVFAGDSGNDLDVLLSPLPSILVGNADAAVRNRALHAAQQESIYFACGGFAGMNGNYSAGILEGVAHYKPELRAEIEALD